MFDVLVMVCAGVAGWLMRKYEFNTAAFVISFVLAKGAEESFRQALLVSDSGIFVFFERPIALAFLLLGIGAILFRVRSIRRERQRKPVGELEDA